MKLVVLTGALLAGSLLVSGTGIPSNGAGSDATSLGTRLAQAILAHAESYAAAGRRNWVNCGRGNNNVGRSLRSVCETEEMISRILYEVDALGDKLRGQHQPYAATVEGTCFRILIENGLASQNAIVRFQVLARIFDFCDNAEFLTSEEGAKKCPTDVEKACLRVLEKDSDGLNRQMALEILGMGYATAASVGRLEALASLAENGSGDCVKIFNKEGDIGSWEHPDLDGMAKKYGSNHSPCEVQLAREALESLKR